MRCTSCGLPLSPQRTHCPRCGKAAGESGKQEQQQVNNQVGTPQFALSAPQEGNTPSASAETPQSQPASIVQQQANNQTPDQTFYASGTEQFPRQMSPSQGENLLSHPEQSSNWQSSSHPDQKSIPSDTIRPGEFQPFPHNPPRPAQMHSRRKVQPGFTVAALCVLSGGLILMLVYIISLNLPSLSVNNQATSSGANKTPVAQNVPPGTQGGLPTDITSTPSLPTATSTPNLPGKTYIDNAQTSSDVDLNTALSSQTTTAFTVKQKIFITFILHPASSGAVCLLWYINQKQFTQYAFPVDATATSQHAYSFAYAYSPGQGSVNIYWASSTACTDKLLAQTVNFTVNP